MTPDARPRLKDLLPPPTPEDEARSLLNAALDAAVDRALEVVTEEARSNPFAAAALRRNPKTARRIARRALLAALEALGRAGAP